MSNIIEGTQVQNFSISDNGRNIRPALIAKSHFFIESSGIGSFSQDENQKFGPVSDTIFRTTAQLSFSGVKNVYAVCKGQVLIVQQSNNPTKVNLILKPFIQPVKDLPIKYFIYRGLNKDDFFTPHNGNIIISGNENSGSGFVRYIWNEFKSFIQNANIPEFTFNASMIGYNESINQNNLNRIDDYFFKIGDDENDLVFELPVIPQGIQLGTAINEIGLDIVLNNGDYYIENDPFKLDLVFAKASLGEINTEILTHEDINIQNFNRKVMRESCMLFIDPAAFIGLHTNGFGTLEVTHNDAVTTLHTAEQIYIHLHNFYTKNTVYLYIQSNRQRSYNFYNNYEYNNVNLNNIMLGSNESSLVEMTFGTEGWPLQLIENHSNCFIQLITGSSEDPVLYSQIGDLMTKNENSFVVSDDIIFESENDLNDNRFSKPFGFKMVNLNNNTLSFLIRIIFIANKTNVIKVLDSSTENPIVDIADLKNIDDVFGLFDVTKNFKEKNNNENISIIDDKLHVISASNNSPKSNFCLIKTTRIEDLIKIEENVNFKRVTFETILINSNFSNDTILKSGSSLNESHSSISLEFSNSNNNFYTLSNFYSFYLKIFTSKNKSITGLLLQNDFDLPITKNVLGISFEEFFEIKEFIILNELKNCKIYFNPQNDIPNSLISIEGIRYKIFKLEIIAENNKGDLEIFSMNNEIILYTIDSQIYFSKAYTDYIPSHSQSGEIWLNTNI